jgi:hypothetical protein
MSNAKVEFSEDVETIQNEYDLQIRKWAAIVKRLGEFRYFKFIPFMRVVGIREVGSTYFVPFANNHALVANRDYEIQIIHMLQSDSTVPHSINTKRTDREDSFIERASYPIRVGSNSEIVSFQKPTIIMNGSYDVNNFIFRITPINASIISHIHFDYEKKSDILSKLDTSMDLPVSVSPDARFPTKRLFAIIAIATIYITPNLYPAIFQYLNVNQRVVQDLAIIAFALTAFDVIGQIRLFLSRK